MLVDSHCHLDFPDFSNNLEDVLERAKTSGVGYLLCVSVDLRDVGGVLKLAHDHTHIFASVGVHPNSDYFADDEPGVEQFLKLSGGTRVVAIGETGLDYYRSTGELDWQRQRFRTHVRVALETGLPLIVHSRAARNDTIRILKEENAGRAGGVMHCFSEDWEMARSALDLGFYISFSGIVTFRNAADLRETAKKVPGDRILVETDAPYLAPVPLRGKTNEPAFISYTAKAVSEIRGEVFSEFAEQTTSNFFRLFQNATRDADIEKHFGQT